MATVMLPSAVFAQSAEGSDGNAQAAAEEDSPFGDIVVTAQKRDQRTQDVGIAIAAFGGDQMNALGVVDVKDVAGGAGAVGHYAVQFARQLGAECILATVSSPEKAEIARLAGADRVINYREEDSLKAILETTNGRGVDLILEVDLAANVDLDVAALAREGRVVAYGSSEREFKMPFSKSILKNIGFDFFILYHLADSRRLEISNGVNDLIESGNIDHNIAEVLPLDSIVKAHELVESGKVVGNVVVAI